MNNCCGYQTIEAKKALTVSLLYAVCIQLPRATEKCLVEEGNSLFAVQ